MTLRYASAHDAPGLYYAGVISGRDKLHWYGIGPDQTRDARLLPGPNSMGQLTLVHQLDAAGDRQVWQGPTLPMGTSYRIELVLAEDGAVTTRFCVLPCDLP